MYNPPFPLVELRRQELEVFQPPPPSHPKPLQVHPMVCFGKQMTRVTCFEEKETVDIVYEQAE